MEILIVSGIWPPEVGGPASHGPELGRFLLERGHRVRAVTTTSTPDHLDPGFPVTVTRKDRPRLIRQPAAALSVLRAASGADVIYATGMYGRSALASITRRVPLVVKLVADPAYERARRLGLFSGTLEEFQRTSGGRGIRGLRLVRRLTLDRAARIITPSRYLAEIVRGWDISTPCLEVIPNPAPPIDRSEPRDELRQRLGLRFPTFVFAGRLVAQKNVSLAISAMRRVREGSLVVIGDGPARGEVERAVADQGLRERVAVRGTAPRAEVLDWLRAADAAILPSDWENFPHAAVEALAAETPVIATAVGGVPEIIEPGVNGILVEPGDAEELGRAMASVAADETLLRTLRDGARATAGRYDRDAVFEEIEAELARAAPGAGTAVRP
jgi:glycosyltransferase involved in cell wall biosynthesis